MIALFCSISQAQIAVITSSKSVKIIDSMSKGLGWLESQTTDKFEISVNILHFLSPPPTSKKAVSLLGCILEEASRRSLMSTTLEYIFRYFDLQKLSPELYELMLKGAYLALKDLYEYGFANAMGSPLFYEIYVHYAFFGYVRAKRIETLLNLPPLLSVKFEKTMRKRIDFMVKNDGSWYPKDEYGGYVGRNAWALMMLSKLGFTIEELPELKKAVDFLLMHKDKKLGIWGEPEKPVKGPERSLDCEEDGCSSKVAVEIVDGLGEVMYTAAAIMGLLRNGVSPADERIQHAIDFLLSEQKPDGRWRPIYDANWPEGFRSYFWDPDYLATILVLGAFEEYLKASGVNLIELAREKGKGNLVELFEPAYSKEQLLLIAQEKLLSVENSLMEKYQFLFEKSFEEYIDREMRRL